MIMPDLIIRTSRRSLSLTITKSGELVVRAPKRLSIDEIFKYIKEKEQWITTKQKEIQERLSINKDIININKILFLGKKYNIKYLSGLKKIELSEMGLLIPQHFKDKDVSKKIKQWLISNAKKILTDRIEYLADLMQIDYVGVTISNSKTRWGSCDIHRNIKLNYRLVMLPHKVLDFVVIHELSHILEFNHSKDFYKIIASVLPSYKLQQRQLKEYDYLLNVLR